MTTTLESPPAAPRLRRLPVPVLEPEPPDPAGASPTWTSAASVGQGELDLAAAVTAVEGPRPSSQGRPSDQDHPSHQGEPAGPDAADAERPSDAFFSPVRTAARLLPDPGPWAARFVQAAVEVAEGVRPPAQLLRWTTLDVHAVLARRAALNARRPAVARRDRVAVRAVRTCQPCDGVCEAAVVVVQGRLARAVAVRMEGLDGRWRATAIEIG